MRTGIGGRLAETIAALGNIFDQSPDKVELMNRKQRAQRKALRRFNRRYGLMSNCQRPHQGAQECSRRVRQGAAASQCIHPSWN